MKGTSNGIVDGEGRVFRHAHQMAPGAPAAGHEGHGGTTTAPPGQLELSVSFPRAGLYKVWVQFRRGTSDVTAPFVIRVR